MPEKKHQPQHQQGAEDTQKTTHKPSRRHVMPGLVPAIVDSFRTPRQYRTIRAVEEDTKVAGTVVVSGLIHDLYDRVQYIERKMAAREEVQSVREFRVMTAERRSA